MMAGTAMKATTERVKESSDIVKVIAEYVRLRKVGATGRYTGLCPFHQEKTPSFSVNQTRQFYKCFGCGVAGDVLKFVMEIEGVKFSQAKAILADRAGIPLSKFTATEKRDYARAAEEADSLARRIADYVMGLSLATERTLGSGRDWLIRLGLDDAGVLADHHRRAFLLRNATYVELAGLWRAMRSTNPVSVSSVERIGREDRENAEMVTYAIVDVLARAAENAA